MCLSLEILKNKIYYFHRLANQVLLRPGIEKSSMKEDRIEVLVLFGRNGKLDKAFRHTCPNSTAQEVELHVRVISQ